MAGGHDAIPVAETGLLIVDLQNDFLHPEGAYGRAGQGAAEIAALPARIAPLANRIRKAGGWIISTQFTLVPAKGGEPLISPHLEGASPLSSPRATSFPAAGDISLSMNSHRRISASRRLPIRPST